MDFLLSSDVHTWISTWILRPGVLLTYIYTLGLEHEWIKLKQLKIDCED